MHRHLSLRSGVLVALALAGGCSDSTEPDPGRSLAMLAGGGQVGAQGAELGELVLVRVTSEGHPLSGAEVRWRVLSGGGSVDEASTVTDAEGVAGARWTLGIDLGEQLLLATSSNAGVTVRATATFGFSAVSAGFRHSCALSTIGEAFCWGANTQGQLGDGTMTDRSTPTRVVGGSRFRSISAGWSHTCAISVDDEAFCWGDNVDGQLGDGTRLRRHVPTRTATSETFASVSTGFVHTCAVAADGVAYCWGANGLGQLGLGAAAAANVMAPSAVSGNGRYAGVSAGEFHTCAVTVDGAIDCWGWNTGGELGTGAPFGSTALAPARVQSTTSFAAVAVGVRHSCAVATDGTAWCWGRNGSGETGQEPFDYRGTPALVPAASGLGAIGTGNAHTCAVQGPPGPALCFGALLGNGTTGTSVAPVVVTGGHVFSSIAVGYAHTCAVAGGAVWCWGSNADGQLARPTSLARADAPVQVLPPPPSTAPRL